ncbi:universal stress protein [Brachybacterium endophyticum]|uniref:universal stress protein n=1 Tax=Brachybacterium endophyticum TaxID=2182385 RepID=UPI001403EC70|nr:universal stress protein [Brachybacterium endophyticum]
MNAHPDQTGDAPRPSGDAHRDRGPRQIVVGVVDERSRAVISVAAQYAKAFHATLTCVYVESTMLALGETPQGSLYAAGLAAEIDDPVFPDDLRDVVTEGVGGTPVEWKAVARRGTPTVELHEVAEDVDALMFVLGTRKPGLRDSMREFINGSVATQLSHRQVRPVVVVPLCVVGHDDDLPWMDDSEG